MAQMKERNPPEKELNKTEKTNLTDAEFKTLVIRIFKELTKYNNSIKKIQEEIKVTLCEIKTNLQGTKNGWDDAKIQIDGLEHKEEMSIQPEKQEGK